MAAGLVTWFRVRGWLGITRDRNQLVVESWRREYNEERPHGALNQITPTAYAADVAQQQREAA